MLIETCLRIGTRIARAALAAAVLVGCASAPPEPGTDATDYKSRVATRTDGGVRVSAVALSADESAAVYGVPLAKLRIQPVWIEVENREDRAYFLLSPGLDPNFYPASEAAEALALGRPAEWRAELDQRFRKLAFHNPVGPGETVSGFVLTNLHEAVKPVQLDLVANGRVRTFSMFSVIPGFRGDYQASGVFKRDFPAGEGVNYTDDGDFRAALEALPCCATNKSGSKNGDPLNLVVVGGLEDAFPALVRRGWRPTEQTWSGSVWRMVTSALSRRALPLCAGQRSVSLRPGAGPRAAEGARQHPPAQPSAAVAEPDALPRQAGLGRPDQPRHRQPADLPFADAHHAQDRPRRGRSARRARRGHGVFTESCPSSGSWKASAPRRARRRARTSPPIPTTPTATAGCWFSIAGRSRWPRSRSSHGWR